MIIKIVMILGMVLFFKALFDKKKVWAKLHQFSSKVDSKLIYTWLNCEFCVLFWIGIVCTGLYFSIELIGGGNFLLPFVVCGFYNLIRR